MQIRRMPGARPPHRMWRLRDAATSALAAAAFRSLGVFHSAALPPAPSECPPAPVEEAQAPELPGFVGGPASVRLVRRAASAEQPSTAETQGPWSLLLLSSFVLAW